MVFEKSRFKLDDIGWEILPPIVYQGYPSTDAYLILTDKEGAIFEIDDHTLKLKEGAKVRVKHERFDKSLEIILKKPAATNGYYNIPSKAQLAKPYSIITGSEEETLGITLISAGGGSKNSAEATKKIAPGANVYHISAIASSGEELIAESLEDIGVKVEKIIKDFGPRCNIIIQNAQKGRKYFENRTILKSSIEAGDIGNLLSKTDFVSVYQRIYKEGKGTLVLNSDRTMPSLEAALDYTQTNKNIELVTCLTSPTTEECRKYNSNLLEKLIQNSFVIANDEEIQDYTSIKTREKGVVQLTNVINAISRIYNIQCRGGEPKGGVFPLDEYGSIKLEPDGHIKYYGVYSISSTAEQNHNGKGDVFAAAITLMYHLQKFSSLKIDSFDIIAVASATVSAKLMNDNYTKKDVKGILENNNFTEVDLGHLGALYSNRITEIQNHFNSTNKIRDFN